MSASDLVDITHQQFKEADTVAARFLSQQHNINGIVEMAQQMVKCLQGGGKIISCGNGGSMCDAMHFAEELSGKYRHHRPALAALAISDAAHLSCVANDYGYAHVFSRYIEAIGKPQDILLALSTSGDSENILNALVQANKQQMTTVLLSGSTGGKAHVLADAAILVPHTGHADRIQELHIRILHTFIHLIEHQLFSPK